jgi:2-polyprenyl-3-methyl-5-hydroxy-6-metoxy-1,4-benzoquinol methylase
MPSRYHRSVRRDAPNNAHSLVLQVIGSNKKVLELGAAGGHVTRALRDQGCNVTAVEIDKSLEVELTSLANRVIIANLDSLNLSTYFETDEKFDVILASDVLEHCVQPELVVLQFHRLLKSDGSLVLSVPNIAHGDVRLSLLAGHFDYRDSGLLDRTHLRFFTKASLLRFISFTGFEVEKYFTTTQSLGLTEIGVPDAGIPIEAVDYVRQEMDAEIYQFVIEARPAADWFHKEDLESSYGNLDEAEDSCFQAELQSLLNSSRNFFSKRIGEMERQLANALNEQQMSLQTIQQLENANADLEAVHNVLNLELESLKEHLVSIRSENLQLRDEVIGIRAATSEFRSRLKRSNARVEQLEKQLDAVYRSRTWRIGRFVLWPKRFMLSGLTRKKGDRV